MNTQAQIRIIQSYKEIDAFEQTQLLNDYMQKPLLTLN